MPKVQEKGQVTLPLALREQLGIQPGDTVEERLVRPGDTIDEAGILVVPRRAGFARFLGLLPGGRTDELMQELRDA